MPVIIPLTYYFLLPSNTTSFPIPDVIEDMDASAFEYTPIPAADRDGVVDELGPPSGKAVALSAADKWRLVKPLLLKYMLPLCECIMSF
jgi:battenin